MSYAIRIEAPALVIKFGTSQEGKKQQKKHIEFTFSSDEKKDIKHALMANRKVMKIYI